MVSEAVWTLFIVGTTNGVQKAEIALYARDYDHARERAAEWIKQHQVELPIISVEAYADGYSFNCKILHPHMGVIVLPGQLIERIAKKLRVSS